MNEVESRATSTAVAIGGSVDSGKCFGIDTIVLQYCGDPIKVQDINRDTILMGDDYTPRRVLETHSGTGKMYKITQDNGHVTYVNGEHILCLMYEGYVNSQKRSNDCFLMKDVVNIWKDFDYLTTPHICITMSVLDFMKLPEKIKHDYKWIKSFVMNPIEKLNKLKELKQYLPYSHSHNNRYFVAKNYENISSIIEISKSLGLCVVQNDEEIIISGNFISNTLNFSTDELLKPYVYRTNDFEIELSDVSEYYGFQTDGNNKFLLNDLSVVHNSTFIGVLISKKLDDGNGSARQLVAKHPHEIESGKTSDISTKQYPLETKNESITLIDLCGHEKYFKTTTFGISGYFPDYAFLIINAQRGVLQMTKQHIRLLLSYSVPLVIIITHLDMVPENVYTETKESINRTFFLIGGKSVQVKYVNGIDDLKKSNEELEEIKKQAIADTLGGILNITDGRQTIYPVISISSKTGFFVDVVKNILENIPPRKFWLPGGKEAVMNGKLVKMFKAGVEKIKDGMSNIFPEYQEFKGGVFYIDCAFNPPGVGLIVSGINRGLPLYASTQQKMSKMYIGPYGKEFHEVRIKSLHNNIKQSVKVLEDHGRGCVNITTTGKEELKRDTIPKGAVMLTDLSLTKNVCYRFKAVITLFSKSITIKSGYTPIIHLFTIRQPARIIVDPEDNNGKDVVTFEGKSTTVAVVTFKFKHRPEYVEPYNMFVMRSGDIQGVGMVISSTSIIDDPDAKPDEQKSRRGRRKYKKPIVGQASIKPQRIPKQQ